MSWFCSSLSVLYRQSLDCDLWVSRRSLVSTNQNQENWWHAKKKIRTNLNQLRSLFESVYQARIYNHFNCHLYESSAFVQYSAYYTYRVQSNQKRRKRRKGRRKWRQKKQSKNQRMKRNLQPFFKLWWWVRFGESFQKMVDTHMQYCSRRVWYCDPIIIMCYYLCLG